MKMPPSLLRRALFAWLGLLLTLSLTACGFHLREAKPLPFTSLYLGVSATSELGAALRRQIAATQSSKLVESPAEAQAVLEVLNESRDKTILSLSAAGRVREFLLTQRFVFRVHDGKGREFIKQSEIKVTRTITYSDTELLSKESEERLLQRDMQNDLITQVMRRLSVVKPD